MARTSTPLLGALKATRLVADLGRLLTAPGSRAAVDRTGGSLVSLLVAVLTRPRDRVVVAADDAEAAHRILTDLRALLPDRPAFFHPGPDVLDEVVLPLRRHEVCYRLRVLDALMGGRRPAPVVVTTPSGLAADTVAPGVLGRARVVIEKKASLDRDALVARLVATGYRRGPAVVAPGELSVRGGILDVFSPAEGSPVRIELWGDEVESMRLYDPSTQRSTSDVERYTVLPPRELVLDDGSRRLLATLDLDGTRADLRRRLLDGDPPEGVESLMAFLPSIRGLVTDYLEPDDLLVSTLSPLALKRWAPILDAGVGEGRLAAALEAPCRRLDLNGGVGALAAGWRPLDRFGSDVVRLGGWLRERRQDELSTVVALPKDGEIARLREILRDQDVAPPTMVRVELHAGFELVHERLALVTGPDLWEESTLKGESDFPVPEEERVGFADWTELEEGCLVVHVDHGIGKFTGLSNLLIDGVRQEFIAVEYARGDRLFVPISQLDRVQKFIGVEGGGAVPKLSRLGGTRWQQVKSKVRRSVEILARELLELYARRDQASGRAFPPDTVWQREMEDSFPFDETRDQLRALDDVKRDMQKGRAMDRLVCGDVGYGKTEVAIRAAFKAVQENTQVAVLVPTTILAQQHFQTFTARLGAFPVRMAVLSRLKSSAEQHDAIRRARRGEVDILIGTHRLLSKDVVFKDLGLLVVDEEQRFGVRHKERIKTMKAAVDVLTLSATPIPRTLNLAMSGVRDISVINTPPKGRLPIATVVQEHDERLVRGAIRREIERGGQVYYVSNRIDTQEAVVAGIRRLVPEARVRAGHGKMDRAELEKLMIDFFNRQYDVLCSTTIIESGLDIPNVNTIIVEDAHRLGLAQLYQLRGRVGRTTRQAYAYLLFPERRVLPEVAFKRLKALEEFTDLGSGFKIAMRDLELRGAGNILGAEQHGFVQTIGFELYTRLLRDAVAELREGGTGRLRESCSIELQVDSVIPEDYVADGELKMLYYRKLAEVTERRELEELVAEMGDRFGAPPPRVESLVRVVRLKLRATELGVTSIRQRGWDVRVDFDPTMPPDETMTRILLRRYGERIQFSAGSPPGFTVDLAGARNQAILKLFEDLFWLEGTGRGL